MRVLQILGAILILGGLFVLIKSPSYSSDKSVLKIGSVEAKVSQQQSIPPWVGGLAVVAGVRSARSRRAVLMRDGRACVGRTAIPCCSEALQRQN